MIPHLEFNDNQNRGEMLFFIVYRHHAGIGNRAIWKPIYKSEIKLNTNNRQKTEFIFNQLSLLVRDICGEDEEKEVKMEFFRS
jgi:hypothetical protein